MTHSIKLARLQPRYNKHIISTCMIYISIAIPYFRECSCKEKQIYIFYEMHMKLERCENDEQTNLCFKLEI